MMQRSAIPVDDLLANDLLAKSEAEG
jgi:hypothetical protein